MEKSYTPTLKLSKSNSQKRQSPTFKKRSSEKQGTLGSLERSREARIETEIRSQAKFEETKLVSKKSLNDIRETSLNLNIVTHPAVTTRMTLDTKQQSHTEVTLTDEMLAQQATSKTKPPVRRQQQLEALNTLIGIKDIEPRLTNEIAGKAVEEKKHKRRGRDILVIVCCFPCWLLWFIASKCIKRKKNEEDDEETQEEMVCVCGCTICACAATSCLPQLFSS